MTETRFVKTHKTVNWWAVLDNGKELLEDEVVELLNEFHEEVERKKDNEKLLIRTANDLNKKIDVLHEENEQLKKDIEALNYELTEIKQSKEDNYNITDGLW